MKAKAFSRDITRPVPGRYSLYRKASPAELVETLVETGETPKRSADRHKDPKAHSAKTAARAKAKRAGKA